MHIGLPGGQGSREGVDYGLGEERAIKKNKISHRAGVFEVSDYCHFCFLRGQNPSSWWSIIFKVDMNQKNPTIRGNRP